MKGAPRKGGPSAARKCSPKPAGNRRPRHTTNARLWPRTARPGARVGVPAALPRHSPASPPGRKSYVIWPIAIAVNECIGSAYAPTAPRRLWGQGVEAMIDLVLIIWFACALPIAVLIGYCTLSEEL